MERLKRRLANTLKTASSNRQVFAVIALVLMAGMAGCVGGGEDTSADSTDTPEPSEEQETRDKIDRVVYPDGGVVCYVMDEEGAIGSGAGWESGISCVPMNETTLAEGDF
jgi:hypothetical protein